MNGENLNEGNKNAFDLLENFIDERFADVMYNGTFKEDTDPMDYIDIRKVGVLIDG